MKLFPRTRSLWFGLTLPFAALKLILTHPILMILSILPIAVSAALYVFLISKAQVAAKSALLHGFQSWGWNPEGWGATLLIVLMKIGLIIVGVLTFSLITGIAAAPLSDWLAEKTEKFTSLTIPSAVTFTMRARLLLLDLGKTILATGASLLALLLSWLPLVNLGVFAFALILVAFQFLSFPQTRRGMGVRASLTFLWRYLYACLGFGAAIAFLFAIPGVSIFALPLAVVGGTLLFARAEEGENTGQVFKLK
ncbi:EI24 domain-containing protein [Bdellovibrionota bacterium FG-2]